MDLYEQEKRVGEYYAKIGEIVRSTWRIKDLADLLHTFAEQTVDKFGWHTVAIMMKRGNRLFLKSFCQQNNVRFVEESVELGDEAPAPGQADVILESIHHRQARQSTDPVICFPHLNSTETSMHFMALPLNNRESLSGVLLLGRTDAAFDDCEREILHDLAEHISLAMDNVLLYEVNEQLLLAEERSRLARELHDSVNQKLFSLSLMAQGLRMKAEQQEMKTGLKEIGELAQEALTELKSLVLDLHPHGDNCSVGELLEKHAARLGLKLLITDGRSLRLSKHIERQLWCIGQEALNNVKKHASTDLAEVNIYYDDTYVHFKISDRGRGFRHPFPSHGKLGLISMRERVMGLGGNIVVRSEEGKGTTIVVKVPLDATGRGYSEDTGAVGG